MKTNKIIYFNLFLLLVTQKIIAQSSVLSSGNWFKISIAQEGIYCLTYSDLISLGINPSSIDPQNISMYGNKAGMLSINNNVPHADDLKEIAITIKGEADGVFDIVDSIFFYGQSQIERLPDLSGKRYVQRQNVYSDSTCYFLTIKSSPGKRITLLPSLATFTNTATTYTDFLCHEMDSINFLHSGKAWYGELINPMSSLTLSFDISHIATGDSVFIKGSFAGRVITPSTNTLAMFFNGMTSSMQFSNVGSSPQDNYAILFTNRLNVPPPINSSILQCSLQSTDPAALCWLDYIEVNITRNLFLFKPQQVFSDLKSAGAGSITRYVIDNANPALEIWDVTDPLNVMNQQFISTLPAAEFNAAHDSLQTYIAFDRHSFFTPQLIGQIPNQDLHSVSQENLIIVTASPFIAEATALANFHLSHDGLQSIAVTTDQIYNEYSSGTQDPVAIRDFVRQVFQRSATVNDSLKYLLLFGGASFDFKNHLGYSSNFVPTYESGGSINLTQTFNTDDFFGYLDSNASDVGIRGDIGIGRLPIKNNIDASVINKIINYNSITTSGRWRKSVTVVADDGDFNTHLRQMDTLANRIENNFCEFDLQKIYFDAYVKDYSGPYPTYPGVIHDLENNIQDGRLVIDYTGHGSEHNWGSENVLDIHFLQNVSNINLPLFIATTAMYNRFDDPADTSGGQIISTNNLGAGIACISSTRLAFSSSNYNFNQKLHSHLFEKENNNFLRLGDIFKKTKQDYYSDPYTSCICLLGDPALKLNYPENEVVTTSINGHPASILTDTLTPGQSLQIDGEIQDQSGNILTSFNGTISILMFNPKTLHYTLGNDSGESFVAPFYAWDDTLIFTSVPAINGIFSSTFNLPYNIDSGYGGGKISYYAKSNATDASGCYQNIIYKNLNSGINELPGVSVSVFPNPTNGKAEINIIGVKVNDFTFVLYDVGGKMLRSVPLNDNKFIIERKSLSAGMYYYEITNQRDRLVKRGKIIFE